MALIPVPFGAAAAILACCAFRASYSDAYPPVGTCVGGMTLIPVPVADGAGMVRSEVLGAWFNGIVGLTALRGRALSCGAGSP